MTTPAPSPCCPCPPPGTAAGLMLCDTAPDGTVVQFVRIYLEDGTTRDTAIGGGDYTPSVGGTVGQCTADQTDGCDTTTPVTAAQLCLADGTPVAVLVQRDCEGTISAPGWVNLATGVYTAGTLPAGAATCEQIAAAGCDTTMPITTEPLCLVDGTPIAVVMQRDCDGVVTSPGYVTLTTGVFTAGAVPAGAGTCEQIAAAECDTTTPLATTGLCLADGTPIATVATRDCDGVISQDGWINLTTGAFTTGLPPAGTIACGAGQSIQVSGVFCDTDPATGEVFALVLVEYHYDDTGAIESVRLVRADDGTTYTLQGELSICPGTGTSMDVESELLCLVDAAGDPIQQVLAEYGYDTTTGSRLFLRFTDPTTGAVVNPPAGATVGACPDPCLHCDSLVLCDTPLAPTADLPINPVAVTPQPFQYISGNPQNGQLGTSQQLWDGQTVTVPGSPSPAGDGQHTFYVARLDPATTPECGELDPAGDVEITVSLTARNDGPAEACLLYGRLSLWNGSTGVGAAVLDGSPTLPVGQSVSPSVTTTVPLSALQAGQITVEFNVETGSEDSCGSASQGTKAWTVSGASITATAAVTGCVAGPPVSFLRTVCRDCPGAHVSTTDTDLGGTTPYTPTGMVGACSIPAGDTGGSGVDREVVCYTTETGDPVPCDNITITPTPQPTFANVAAVATGGFTITGLANTINGDHGQPFSNFAQIDTGSGPATGVIIDYTLAAAANNVSEIRLYNCGGAQIFDGDGIGTATATFYNAANTVLWTGTLQGCCPQTNADTAPCITALGTSLNGVSRLRLENLTKLPLSSLPPGQGQGPNIVWRELEIGSTTTGTLTASCGGETVTAEILGAPGGLTYSAGQLTQVNGPHDLVFSTPAGVSGRIVTDPADEGAFSALEFADGTVITVSGDSTVAFGLETGADSGALGPTGVGFVSWDEDGNPILLDANTGLPVPDATIVPCRPECGCAPIPAVLDVDSYPLCVVSATGTVVQHVRRQVLYDGEGTATDARYVDAVTGAPVTVPAGATITVCPDECRHCTERVLCDDGGTPTPATISGTTASGTLANGVSWQARSVLPVPPRQSNVDGSWWGIAGFPNPVVGPTTYTFDHAVDAVFSLVVLYQPGTPGGATQNQFQIPIGSEPVALPPGYSYDAATGVVTGGPTLTSCPTLNDPRKATAARFRLRGVTSFTIRFLGVRTAICGQFGNFAFGGIDVTPAAGKFMRTICRGCNGAVIGAPVDTAMDGVNPYVPRGTVGACEDCQDCETLTLCDVSGDPTDWANVGQIPINGNSKVLGNGIRFGMSATSPMGGNVYPDTNSATWLIGTSTNVASINVDRPAQARFFSSISEGTTVRLPVGAVVERLAPLHSYNAAQRTLTGLPGARNGGTDTGGTFDPDANLSTIYVPRAATRADFAAVVLNTAPGATNAFTWDEIAIAPAPPFEFLRRICHGCDGLPMAPVDTLLDGQTPFVPGGTVRNCDAARDCSCTPEQVCIQQDPVQVREFISNADHIRDNSPDPVWEWTPQTNGLPLTDPNFGPAANATWHDMYRPQNIPADRWTIEDTDTERPASWITPHPNGAVAQSTPPLPGEGPNVPGNADWFGRAYFDLPANADPSSIQIQVTVLNADQYARSFRLNDGPWQTINLVDATGQQGGCFEADAPEFCQPYTFPAQAVPGSQAGRNTLYMRVHETVGGASGVIAHMIVTYQVSPPARRSWTRMRCCDGSFYYLDESGQRHDDLPTGWVVAPCGSGESDPVLLCDDNGPFLRHVTYLADGSVSVSDTSIDGGDYTPAGTPQACGGTGGGCAATTSTVVLCDVQDAGGPGATVAVNFAALNGPYPDTVTLANGVAVGVDQGGYNAQPPTPPGSFFLGVSGTDPQVWTFDQPSTVRFRITPANVTGNTCLQLPAGAVVENVQPGVTHNAGTNQLCQTGSITTTTGTTVRVDNTSGFQVSVSGAGAGNNDWTFRAMEVTPNATGGGTTAFLRHITTDCEGTVIVTRDTTLDGQTIYMPGGTVEVCQGGAAIAMAATLSMGELTAHHLDVVPGTPWTPDAIGWGAITALTYTVLSGTATVIDSNGQSIAGLPAGVTGTWSNDQQGDLVPPQSITAAPGSRVLVAWTER